MSLNVENLFVKCDDQARVVALIETYWRNTVQPRQPDWGLPASFETLLAKEQRRKVAISPPRDGWVAVVESKEVVDFALACELSEKLDTAVLVIQVAEGSGGVGYASAVRGQVLESVFNEEDDDPVATVGDVLRKYRVPFKATLFREAIQGIPEGWSVKQKK